MSKPYRVCEFCGANLDPGERCDCQKVAVASPKHQEALKRLLEMMNDEGEESGDAQGTDDDQAPVGGASVGIFPSPFPPGGGAAAMDGAYDQ